MTVVLLAAVVMHAVFQAALGFGDVAHHVAEWRTDRLAR